MRRLFSDAPALDGLWNRWERCGLTLLELLVVVALLAVLAGMILPAVSKARTQARNIQCLNNLRQWGTATLLFAAEHNDFLPKDGAPNGTSVREGWYVDLPKLLSLAPYRQMEWRTNANVEPGRSPWICPSNRRRTNGRNLFHYCLNQHVNRHGTGRQIQLGSLSDPQSAVWLFDNGKLAAVAQQNNVHTNLHQRGAQFLFLDGHAARFPARDYWDLKTDKGRTNNPDLDWFP